MKTRSTKRPIAGRIAARERANQVSDAYLELIRDCPLRIIQTQAEYQQAVATVDRLSDLGPDRTVDETDYLLALALFVERYEKAHEPRLTATGVEMLAYLIETHGVTQRNVAAGTRFSESTISEILAGTRKMNVKHIEALARFFKVEPGVFLDD